MVFRKHSTYSTLFLYRTQKREAAVQRGVNLKLCNYRYKSGLEADGKIPIGYLCAFKYLTCTNQGSFQPCVDPGRDDTDIRMEHQDLPLKYLST